jgi:phage portal protein BeeE
VRKTSAAIAGWLGETADMRLSLSPDLDQVPALSDEREALWRRVTDADFLTDAEKRELLGLAARHGDTNEEADHAAGA